MATQTKQEKRRADHPVLDVDPEIDQKKLYRGNFSGGLTKTGRRLAVLQRKYHEYLLSDDANVLPIVLGAVAAHRFDGEPTWLLIVGPPSGAKTDLLSLLNGVDNVRAISDLTDKTLASGYKPATGGEPSLLAQLDDAILSFKDFTTVLEMDRTRRAQVLAQLREIYDGKFDKSWGNGKHFRWQGRVSVLAGVTPVIDQHYAVMNVLGQRFMLLRPRQPDRQDAGLRALDNCSSKGIQAHDDLVRDVQAFLSDLPTASPTASQKIKRLIVRLADLTTRARSAVKRSGYGGHDLDYVPEPEMPARFGRQLLSLARGVALVHGHAEVTEEDISCVRRVALDSIPTARRALVKALVEANHPQLTSTLASVAGFSESFTRRTLEDLEILHLIARRVSDGPKSKGDRITLCDDWSDFFGSSFHGTRRKAAIESLEGSV